MSVMLGFVWFCALCIVTCCGASAASTAYEQAFELHQEGDLNAAAVLYQLHLQAEPGSYDAMHMLGLVHYMKAQSISDTASQERHSLAQQAEALVRQAVAAMPRDSYLQALGNLCEVLRLQVSYDFLCITFGISLHRSPAAAR
jgi:thioredoxin-like negative regulator of GroEL